MSQIPSADPTTAPPPPPFGSPRPRQLRRRPDRGPIGGVCAGVAEYFRLDPVIVRIAAVVLAISGPGVIAYVLAWIFVPAASGPSQHPSASDADRADRGAQIFGIVLLVVALCVLWGDWWSPARRWIFPLGLMALGTWLLLRRGGLEDGTDRDGTPPLPPTSPVAPATPPTATPFDAPVDAPAHASVEAPVGSDATAVDDTAVHDTPVHDAPGASTLVGDSGDDGGEPPTAPWAYDPPPDAPERNGTARRRRRMLGPIVMGALLVWSGIAFVLGVSVENGLAVGLCIVGVGFVLGAFVGGSWPLIVPAFLIGGALIVASVADIPLSGPVGDRTWAPQEVSAVQDLYELSVGEGTLDLTAVTLGPNEVLAIKASIGVGHLVIEVPTGVAVDIVADVSAGETQLLGHIDSGVGVSTNRSLSRNGDVGRIRLDLQVGLGQIEVHQAGNDAIATAATTSTTIIG